ncbi:MAG TPA: DNA polymerase domain-containing protein [Candidatus Binataceae bacterium]|jgi:DNA polymerase elongation subunit (family B)|nr:DNA polymerase domain-containing protein [Candidatus Binataceae bacterium]
MIGGSARMSRYQEISRQFYGNRLLFGDPAEAGVVAVEIASSREVEVFKREGRAIVRERRPFKLFVLIAERSLMEGFRGDYELVELAGDFRFRYALLLDSLEALEGVRRHLRAVSGKAGGATDAPWFALADPVEQYLMLSGTTFFMGLQFGDLRRLQLDIETYISAGFEFPTAAREGDRIVAIALSDTDGFERVLRGDAMDERTMLEALVRVVRERDPDVIEGHNLFRFDFEYLEERARRHGIRLALGRDGSGLRGRPSRMQIAERSIAFRRYDINGRSIIDTWILAQHYDIASRALESFGLKDLAIHFGLASADRVYLDASRVSEHFEQRPEELFAYALDDVRETRALAAVLAPSYFVQAQIFPYSLQSAVLRGNATKIDALLMRAYLAARHSIPQPAAPSEVAGGYTEVRRCGVARNVLHCDVTSLYPSLMIEGRHQPAADRLGVFLKLLEDLRSFRVQAKAAVRELSGAERRDLEALQQTFKILINSFYGYLGFGLGHFNDFEAANVVTRRGRELINRAVDELEARSAQVIEVDTDGIYFVAPFTLEDEAAAQALIDEIGESMPAGIRLEIDGRYPAMFSYKMKNYVLLDERGEMTTRGSGLKSRGLERFQRTFMQRLFRLLLEDRREEIPALYAQWRVRIERREMGIRELMKTETLQDSPELYREKIGGARRNIAAAYELALKATRPYLSGDQISYYVGGRGAGVKVNAAAKMAAEYDATRPDENVEYYLAKLADLYEKFRPFVERPGLFSPSEIEEAQAADSGQLELFAAPGKTTE